MTDFSQWFPRAEKYMIPWHDTGTYLVGYSEQNGSDLIHPWSEGIIYIGGTSTYYEAHSWDGYDKSQWGLHRRINMFDADMRGVASNHKGKLRRQMVARYGNNYLNNLYYKVKPNPKDFTHDAEYTKYVEMLLIVKYYQENNRRMPVCNDKIDFPDFNPLWEDYIPDDLKQVI